MLWFSLALATAFFSASTGAYAKRHFGDLPPFEMAFYPMAYAAPYLLALLAFTGVPDTLAPGFWRTFLILLPLNILGMTLQYRAFSLSPLSLTLPYLALTPAFTMVLAWPVLAETPNAWGGAGVLVLVAGCYLLNIEAKAGGGWAAPLKAMGSEPGARAMLGAALVYGLTSVLGRKGILLSDPLFFTASFFLAQSAVVCVAFPLLGLARPSCLLRSPGKGLVLGGLQFLEFLCHSLAVSMVKAAYMVAIKRFNAVIGVGLGGFFLGEDGMRPRLAGAALMVAGAAIIGLLGS